MTSFIFGSHILPSVCRYIQLYLHILGVEYSPQEVVHIVSTLTNRLFPIIIIATYKECARDKLYDRTATCRMVRC
nr:MAG TPA: hypothetical protein [Caudoviricetes sp.]